MNNNISITDSKQFEEVIISLEDSYKKIQSIFSNERKNKEEINCTDTWTGNAQEAMYDKYSKLTANFAPIEYSLDIYIKFLKKTLDDYKKADMEISNNIEQISGGLDVNS